MKFFEKTKRVSNYFFAIFVLFLILTIIFFALSQFTEVISHNFTNDLRGTIWMLVCFIISMSSLMAGISLNYLIKEYNDAAEIKLLEERIKINRS